MQAILEVKNFGPIKNVKLDLRNVNVFIGPQASGKSALAKVYTICKSPLSFYSESKENLVSGSETTNLANFKKTLEDYNILSFLANDTYINFNSELHSFKYEYGKITYERKFIKRIERLEICKAEIEANKAEIINILSGINEKLFGFRFFIRKLFTNPTFLYDEEFKLFMNNKKIDNEQLESIIKEITRIENDLSSRTALYIPAERNFIPIIKGASLNLLNNNVPIPKHILSFGAEFEKASFELKELDLDFIKEGIKYKNEDGKDVIYFSANNSIKLTESASGLQSVVPLLLPILARKRKNELSHHSFVIEEAELNLFPLAQYKLIKELEKNRLDGSSISEDIGTIHTYTTHSPYILSAFNNLLYAYKARNYIRRKNMQSGMDYTKAINDAHAKVTDIIPVFISARNFSAYQISNGGAMEIFNRESELMDENYIDQSSDEMSDDFERLMEIMKDDI